MSEINNTEQELENINQESQISEEEYQIEEEYKIWKKNSPYLYDILLTSGTEWPSLTIDWLPILDISNKSYFSVQKMIIGTITNGKEPDYLMIAKARLPININLLSDIKDNPYINKDAINSFSKPENSKIEIETKILHEGEVNKARSMPQKNKYQIIATKTIIGEIHIYDYFKHPPKPLDNKIKPERKLIGHNKEGYGLSWSIIKEGYLLSGAYDKLVCLYDINSISDEPILKYNDHTDLCEDVSFHKKSDYIFASCGDDNKIYLYDYREKKSIMNVTAHESEVNSIDFNPLNEFLLISASSDKTCALWDIRNINLKLHSFIHHNEKVMGVKWNNKLVNIFASYGDDRRINIWDISQIGKNISNDDNDDGPSELIFTHGGHTDKVNDISWNKNDELMCASVAENNVVHLWEMNNDIYYNEDK